MAKKNSSGKKNLFLWISAGLIALAIVAYLVMHFWVNNMNRSPKTAAEYTFRAIYGFDYDTFMESSIYSDTAQKYLKMEVFDDITQIEGEFQNSRALADTYHLSIEKAAATEYNRTSEEYLKGITLLRTQNPEAKLEEISGVALVTIDYRMEFGDQNEKGSENYWVYRIHGRWYCHPLVNEVREY